MLYEQRRLFRIFVSFAGNRRDNFVYFLPIWNTDSCIFVHFVPVCSILLDLSRNCYYVSIDCIISKCIRHEWKWSQTTNAWESWIIKEHEILKERGKYLIIRENYQSEEIVNEPKYSFRLIRLWMKYQRFSIQCTSQFMKAIEFIWLTSCEEQVLRWFEKCWADQPTMYAKLASYFIDSHKKHK